MPALPSIKGSVFASLVEDIHKLVAANRLYRQSALRAGEAGVADVLDELERFLVEVANAPTPLDASDVRELNERIEARGLLFKVRIVGSRLRERHRETDGVGDRPLRSQG